MNFENWKKSYRSLKTETGLNRLTVVFSAITTAPLGYKALTQETVVVVPLWTLEKSCWVGEESASQSYKEARGLVMAQMLGNITPSNLDFIADRRGLLLKDLYQDVMTAVKAQIILLRESRITTRFESVRVMFEKVSDKVLVYGNYFTKAHSVREKFFDRTYEVAIGMNTYLPMLLNIDTYDESQTCLPYNLSYHLV